MDVTPTYNWSIELKEYYPEYMDKEKVVHAVYWKCTATAEKDGKTFVSVMADRQELLGMTETFIDYDSLAPETVLNWIWNLDVNKDQIEAALAIETQKRIQSAKAPIPEYFQRMQNESGL